MVKLSTTHREARRRSSIAPRVPETLVEDVEAEALEMVAMASPVSSSDCSGAQGRPTVLSMRKYSQISTDDMTV